MGATANPNDTNGVFAPFHHRLAFGTFDFSAIRPEHFAPALAAARTEHKAQVEAIVANPEEPDFDNTIDALARSGRWLGRITTALGIYAEHAASAAIDAVVAEDAERAAAHEDDINMNRGLWERIERVHVTRRGVGKDPERARLLDETWREFARGGAGLPEHRQAALRAANQEEAGLMVSFAQRVRAAREAATVSGNDLSDLAGMDPEQVAAAQALAAERGDGAAWALALDSTSTQQAAAQLDNEDLRQRLFQASLARNGAGEHDTRPIIARLAKIRSTQAQLLGYDSFAAYALEAQMTATPGAMRTLLQRVAGASAGKAAQEARALERMTPGAGNPANRARAEAAQRLATAGEMPAITFPGCLRALFHTAQKLYGLRFIERQDIPVFDPHVRTFEVLEENGQSLALMYIDPYARTGKSGGAWMNSWVDQNRLFGEKAVVGWALNLQAPAPGTPCRMTAEDVVTAFHEFGHALHGMLSSVHYPQLSGINVPTDFVEMPSQLHEHWAFHPDVLPHYGEAGLTPGDARRLERAARVGQGYANAEVAGAALLDLAWHERGPDAASIEPGDVAAFERQVLLEAGINPDIVPPRYASPYFIHIWGGEYAACYGAYTASAVLECDGFAWFQENGGLTRANGEHFRRTILSRGNAAPAGDLWLAFRGREAQLDAFLEHRGLATSGAAVPDRRPGRGPRA